MNVDTATLRQFINDKFGSQDLNDLLFDYFRSVHEDLTPGMTKRQQISLLLEFCRQHNQMENLLAAVAQMRPFFQPDDYVQGRKATIAAAPQPPAPITRNPRQIFISHAHQDAEIAERLADDLVAEGYAIWMAPDSILPGEKWAEAIGRGLDSSGLFLLLMSPEAVGSKWVNTETNIAIEFNHEGEMQLYPLLLRACRVPALWRAYQRISLRSGYSTALRQLLAALAGGKPLPTAPPVRTPPADPNRWLHPKSGLELVRVPAGEFLYGDDKKKLHLDEFWMAKTPVTNAEYKRFLDANPNYDVPFRDETWAKPYNWDKQQRTFPAGKAEHPVVLVSWHDAQAFAKWAGMVLPTEEQWQKAARGTDGREYPWGEWRAGHCNTSETGIGATTPVGQFSPQGDSPYGCVDMSGNVWEWTNSWYDEKQVLRVLCGGSWPINRRFARVALRSWYDPDNSFNHIGFRVVSPVVSGF